MGSIAGTASITGTLSTQEINTTLSQTALIGAAAQVTVQAGQFVFFAAFDGTNNDRANLELSGAKQATNVAQLEEQAAAINVGNLNFKSGYYAGVGTGGIAGGFDARSTNPTPYVLAIAEKAYTDFATQAQKWLDADPSRSPADITASMTGFSRGAGTAVVFAQLLNERGLTLPDGTVVVPPGQVAVSSALLFDPVFSGIDRVMSLPANVTGNVVVVQALDEFRTMFQAADFSNDPRVQTIGVYGNHGNIGGFYDNGIGALVLEGATRFFKNSGLSMASVPVERKFDETKPPPIYSEGVDNFGHVIWSEYGARGSRLTLSIPAPIVGAAQNTDVDSIVRIDNSIVNPEDVTKLIIVTYKDGRTEQQLFGADDHPVLTAAANEQLARNTVTGVYAVTNTLTQRGRSFDPVSGELTFTVPGHASVVVDRNGNIIKVFEPTGVALEQTTIEGQTFYLMANGLPYRKINAGYMEIRDPAGDNGAFVKTGTGGILTPDTSYARWVQVDGSVATVIFGQTGQAVGVMVRTSYDDGSTITDSHFVNGFSQTITTNTDGSLFSREVTTLTQGGSQLVDLYNGTGALVSSKTTDYFDDENGRSRIETITTYANGAATTVRNAYGTDGNLYSSIPVAQPAVTSITDQQVTTVLNDIAGLVGAIQGGKPLPILSSGLHLLNTFDNLDGNVSNDIPYLTQITAVVGGLASLYSLSNALENGDTLSKVSATLSTLNYVNSTLPALLNGASAAPLSASLNGFLNGTGTGASGSFAGLGAGNVPGVLPVLGLVMSIRSGDAVGTIQGIMGLVNPALLTSPIGWVLIGVQILKAFDEPPESWGSAKLVFDANGQIKLDAVGEGLGPQRVRQQLQGTLDVLNTMVAQAQAGSPGNPLGIVPQRMPSITWREARQDDKGYAISDVAPITGEQRYPYLRWDDAGVPFSSQPSLWQPDPAKGLRSLAAFDANADSRIDALDPVYAQLKVWQDLNQDGNSTHSLQIGPNVETAQDEANGVQELRSLADWGISAIDYGNSRYEYASTSGSSNLGYGSISTQTLEAQDEGVLYTAVQGGIRIDATNDKPEVVVTQALSEQAVYDQYKLETAGETISLNEDGSSEAYSPDTQGGAIGITGGYRKHSSLRTRIGRYTAKRYSKPCANEFEWKQVA